MPGFKPQALAPAGLKGDIQQLFNAMPIGVLLVHLDGTILLANRCALDLLGYSADELLNAGVDTLVPEPVRPLHVNHRKAYATDPVQRPMGYGRDLRARRKDGTTFPVEIGLAPYEHEGHFATLCTIVDITERKRQDAEREGLVWELETQNAVISALYTISRLTRDGTPSGHALPEIANAVRGGLLGAPVTGVRVTIDGTSNEDGQFCDSNEAIRANIIVEDRQRGQIEAFLAEDHIADGRRERDGRFHTLVTAVAEALAESLERSEAMQKVIHASQLASIGELAAGIGHEVNNPINGIINCADILLRSAKDGTKEKQYLELIKQESYRIASIVGSLLAFARSGRSNSTSTPLRPVLDNVLTLCRKRIEKSQVDLRVASDDDLPAIACRPEQMQQVLLNIVLNALHALDRRYPDGHPDKRLSISARQTMAKNAPHVEVIVEDNGTGIDPDHRERIFDPFFTTKGQEGTGLGLAVSLNIVRSHGGWIDVESELGRFTRFIIKCPVKQPEQISETSGHAGG